jgi:glycosyltransferase involved in cell wall biosynthesis
VRAGMRIVYMLTSLGIGGAERQVLALAQHMAERGNTVAFLVLRPHLAEEWPTTLHVVHLDMRKTPVSLLVGMTKGRRFLRDFRPDLIHGHSFHANIVARLSGMLAPATAVVSTVHNVYEGGWPRMLGYRLTDGLSCRTTAVSQAVASRFINLKAVPQNKCQVIANGIDTAEFAPSEERRAAMRAAMGVADEFLWLTAGRIAPAKDYPNLLRAFALVHMSRPQTQLWIAGEANGAEAFPLRDLAAELGLSDSVRWLGLRRDLPALLDAADGFVLGSAWEGMPLAVGEAMAMETPIAATEVGGVRELVGEAGLIVPSKAPDALAAAMLDLMGRSADDRHTLGKAARQRIVASFSMEAKADEWEALYRSILDRTR